MEVHVQKQLAELDQQQQKDWQFMQEKHMALQKQNESLVNDLIACQDMILEKTQTHPLRSKARWLNRFVHLRRRGLRLDWDLKNLAALDGTSRSPTR